MSSKTETPFEPQARIHDLFEHQAAKTPDRVAVAFESDRLTYGELNAQANQLAHWLIKNGVVPDDIVALHMGRSLELMVALLGVLKAGAAYLPLDPQYPRERLVHMAHDSRARTAVPKTPRPTPALRIASILSSTPC